MKPCYRGSDLTHEPLTISLTRNDRPRSVFSPGCSPVSRTMTAAPFTVWAASFIAIALGRPIRTPPSASASISTKMYAGPLPLTPVTPVVDSPDFRRCWWWSGCFADRTTSEICSTDLRLENSVAGRDLPQSHGKVTERARRHFRGILTNFTARLKRVQETPTKSRRPHQRWQKHQGLGVGAADNVSRLLQPAHHRAHRST